MRQQNIRVERGNKGFGLSLIYKGLDKFPEEETGTYVAKVVPGGNSARAGLKPNDKVLKINNRVPRDVNDAVELIKRAGRNLILTVSRSEEEGGSHFSRSGSVRSFNTGYGGGDSRPITPATSGDEDEEHRQQVEQTRQQLLRQQELQRQQEMQIQQDIQRQQELQRQQEIQRQQELQRQQDLQRQQAQREQLERHQQEVARQEAYERQLQKQAEHERQLQAEHERQMKAAEEEARHQKLQAELDQARVNAGKGPERRSRRDSSSDDEGWPSSRSKSVDGRRRNRSKSPGSLSMRSNKSWADLTDEAKLTRNEEKE